MFMANEPATMKIEGIDSLIFTVRGQRVMLDADLAVVYGVSTKRLNEQLKRNRERFPADFAFRLTAAEVEDIRSQFATASTAVRSQIATGSKRNVRFQPWAFTEHGAIMLATILNSPKAVEMSVFVVRAFVQMREMVMSNRQLAAKLDELEERVTGHDTVIGELVAAIRQMLNPSSDEKPKREIGFHMRETAPPYRISRRR